MTARNAMIVRSVRSARNARNVHMNVPPSASIAAARAVTTIMTRK
jgi:hypothetical protein